MYDIAVEYQENGIKGIEKRMDRYLAKPKYWYRKISKSDVRFGWYENQIYLLVLDTDKKEIGVYDYDMGIVSNLLRVDIVLGRNGVGKSKEGDRRTPVGIYSIVQKKEHLAPLYGPFAFVTNYPNSLDRTLQKDGAGIWIHGFPPNDPDKSFTKGCIATPNQNLLKLDKTIDYKSSLVIISQGKPLESSKDEISKIMAFIYEWRFDWKYNLIEKYLSLYSKDLISSNGNFQKFSYAKRSLFARNLKKTIIFKNFQVTRYPNTSGKKIWRVVMDEYYKAPNYRFSGKKSLYILETENGFKIWREL